jgi:hypothetical protein
VNTPTREERPPAKEAAPDLSTATKQATTTVPPSPAAVPGHAGTVPPVVQALRVSAPDRYGNRSVTVPCPWCHRRHLHGLPAGDTDVGHRVTHCTRDAAYVGYVVHLAAMAVAS